MSKLATQCKKPSTEAGRRLGEDIHPPGLNTKATGSQETTGSRIEAKESQLRNRPNYFKRKDCTEKRQSVQQDKLVCAYANARNIINKF